jgi:LPXTG-motif cell wall-anchored protein
MNVLLRAVALLSVFLTSLVFALFGASPAHAATTCDDLISGDGWSDKVEGNFNDGDPELTVSAPEGFLIDMYCVKAGPDAIIVPVNPPAETVTIDFPGLDSVSHFAFHVIAAPTEPPTSETPSEPVSETPTTSTPGGPIQPPPEPIEPPQAAPPTLPNTGDQENLWALGALGLAVVLAGVSLLVRRSRSWT